MNRIAFVVLGLVAAGVAASGCNDPAVVPKPLGSAMASVSPSASSASSASSEAASKRSPRPTNPAPKPEVFTVRTVDGVRIKASKWSGGSDKAPAVVLVHRLGGTRDEWKPLVERIFPPKHPLNVVAMDLRGHGASTSGKAGAKLAWQSFDKDAFKGMDADLRAIVSHLQKKGGPPAFWVLVGSDLGATLAVRQANEQKGDVAGLALISPGAALRGIDIYRPFSSALRLPNLLVSGNRDSVSHDASKTMASMSKTSKLISLKARGHGAEFLGKERWEMWDELANWIEARVNPKAHPAVSSSAVPTGSASKIKPSSSGR